MTKEVLEYCYRGIIQHLNGDIKKFKYYVDKAVEAHYNDKHTFTIEDRLTKNQKRKLYEMVN